MVHVIKQLLHISTACCSHIHLNTLRIGVLFINALRAGSCGWRYKGRGESEAVPPFAAARDMKHAAQLSSAQIPEII